MILELFPLIASAMAALSFLLLTAEEPLSSLEQSRRPEHDRPTASPR
jgi:hypothetical protein